MKRLVSTMSIALLALSGSVGAQTLNVTIEGPGGHSSGNYGNVNAVHAAARAIQAIEASVPDAVITNFNGGSTVNAIAADARFTVHVTKAEEVERVKVAVAKGCEAENAFRGVKAGEVRQGVASDIRWTVESAK